ncbi:SIMPL domain-containing protein [Sphaerotilus uruguayifluvii]|uniref:Secreted protein n=1 Tax=Sphaerotilus uruguayifluvii TaxID=2735897 RepID=A0ABX2G8Q8_9BURK|nr:putative secreted protein [Leptothrix sp. C29]
MKVRTVPTSPNFLRRGSPALASAALAVLAAALAPQARAQAVAPVAAQALQANQLGFSASAQTEVARDELSVSLQAVRDGSDATQVQTALKQVLDAALAEARRAAEGQQMTVRTSGFSIQPRYGRDGRIAGWSGNAGLTLEGRDVARIAATAGRLQGMNIVATGYSLSRELRERHESALTEQAIRRFRERAAEMARQFGYTGYLLREVTVQDGEVDSGVRPMPMARMVASTAAEAAPAPLPTEGGRATLSVTVQGTVTMTR